MTLKKAKENIKRLEKELKHCDDFDEAMKISTRIIEIQDDFDLHCCLDRETANE